MRGELEIRQRIKEITATIEKNKEYGFSENKNIAIKKALLWVLDEKKCLDG